MLKINTSVLFYTLFWIYMVIELVIAEEWEPLDNATYVSKVQPFEI
jgi:hypothetical protein